MRGEYAARRDALREALARHCPRLEFDAPAGGFFLWCRLPAGMAARELLREALREGVSFISGENFYPDGRGQDRIRLSFPGQTPEFDEVTVVLEGTVVVEHDAGRIEVRPGEAMLARAGERIRYSTPQGAEYVAICVPAFTPEAARRDE